MECWWLAVASVSQSQCVASSYWTLVLRQTLRYHIQVTVACTMYTVDLLQTETLTPVPTVCVRLPPFLWPSTPRLLLCHPVLLPRCQLLP